MSLQTNIEANVLYSAYVETCNLR